MVVTQFRYWELSKSCVKTSSVLLVLVHDYSGHCILCFLNREHRKLGPISHYLFVILLHLGRSGAPFSEKNKSAAAYTGRLHSISYPCVPKETRNHTLWLLVQIVHCLSWRLLASSIQCFFTYFFHTCLCLSHIPDTFHLYVCFFVFLFQCSLFLYYSSLHSFYRIFSNLIRTSFCRFL